MFHKSKRGPHFINATTLNIYLWKFGAVSILKVYDAALIFSVMMAHRDNLCSRKTRCAPRGQVTARNNPGGPYHPVRPRPDPRTLSCPEISFEPRTRGWLHATNNVHERRSSAQRPGDSQKRSGEVPRRPCGVEARPPGPIISFEPRTRGWLAKANTGLLG